MGRVEQFLENSAVARALSMEASGEGIDVSALARRQVLDMVRVGQIAALELLEADQGADQELEGLMREWLGIANEDVAE